MKAFAILALMFSGCTTTYENGKPVFRTSSNIAGLRYRSPAGTVLDAQRIDNASMHRSFWNGFSKGILSTGTAIFTAGGTMFLK